VLDRIVGGEAGSVTASAVGEVARGVSVAGAGRIAVLPQAASAAARIAANNHRCQTPPACVCIASRRGRLLAEVYAHCEGASTFMAFGYVNYGRKSRNDTGFE